MKMISLLQQKRIEILAFSSIIFVSFILRLFLLVNVANPMYFYDSYSYYFNAWQFLESGTLPSNRVVYVLILASWLYLFDFLGDPLFLARIFVIFLSLLVVCVVYLLARKVMSRSFALVTSLLVSLEPRFLSLSITTHNDIFFILTGLSSLYFSTSKSKVAYLILAPVCFAISTLTSEWVYVLIGPGLLLIYISRISKSHLTRLWKYALSIMAITAYLSLFLLPEVQSFYYSGTRFSPLQRMSLFFTPDLVSFTLTQILGIVAECQFMNVFFTLFVLLGSLLIVIDLMRYRKRVPFSRERENYSLKKDKLLTIILVLIFFSSIFVITVFTISYKIVGDNLIIIKEFNLRYVTLPRIFAVLIFAYFCSTIVTALKRTHIPKVEGNTVPILRNHHTRTLTIPRKLHISVAQHRAEAGKILHVTLLIALVIFASGFAYSGYNLTSNSSAILANFADASAWLGQNLLDSEMAIVPFITVFYSLAPELHDRLIPYSVVWKAAGIVLTASTTIGDILVVRQTLAQLLLNRTEIKYLVFDTLDPYAQLMFYSNITDQLSSMLSNLTTFPRRSDWTNQVKIITVKSP